MDLVGVGWDEAGLEEEEEGWDEAGLEEEG